MKKIFIICSCLLLMIIQDVIAQQIQPVDFQNKKFVNNIHPASRQGWVEFRNENPYHGDKLFSEQPELLNMQADDEMRIFKTNTDRAGNKHYKYAQYYKGVRIEGIEHIVHERNGRVSLANGNFIAGMNLNVIPSISPEQSIAAVLAKYPAEKYLWEDEEEETHFKKQKNDENATLYPAPELLLVKKNTKDELLAENYMLAYRMYIFAKKPHLAKAVYVDAHTGEILRDKPMEIFCNTGEVETTYNGTQTVNTDFRTEDCGSSDLEETEYFSINDCNTDSEIRSYMSGTYTSSVYGEDWLECDADNIWSSTSAEQMVMTSLWAVSKAFAYYDAEFGHESFDGSSGLIDVFSNKTYFNDDDEPYCTNANFTNFLDNIYFGAGYDCEAGTTDDYNPLDIAGHEYAHGIIEYAHYDALDYSEESGALNESFADIFGEMTENWVEGGAMTWLHGDDMTTGPNRSFISPNDEGQPDTYLGDMWYDVDGDDDNGGVHTNSGVQNHMFYLLSEGGSGVNDFNVDYHVEGIGSEVAEEIAWHAMMNYLNAADGYFTARNAWIQSAIDLYGSCSQEVISVGQAWQAVGVTFFTSYDVASVCGTYTLTGYADATHGIENSNLLFGVFVSDCATTVNSPAVVTFESGYYVELNPGFEAKSGSTFVALIDECEVSEYDPDDVRIANIANENTTAADVFVSEIKMYPSPADASVSLDVNLQQALQVSISVFDITGKEIAVWVQGEMFDTGIHQLQFETSSFSNGMYISIIKAGSETYTNKFIVQH